MITIPVYKGRRRNKRIVAEAYIDDSDQFLTRYQWSLHSDGYVYRSNKTSMLYLHRVVLWYDGPQEVNHINGNPLDNQSSNLEICSNSRNKLNPNDRVRGMSRFRGVTKDSNVSLRCPWRGKIKVNGRLYCTKRFATEIEAAEALNSIRSQLGLPMDLRVNGDLPRGYGNPFARKRHKKIPADVRPK